MSVNSIFRHGKIFGVVSEAATLQADAMPVWVSELSHDVLLNNAVCFKNIQCFNG